MPLTKEKLFKVDLTKIEGEGGFPCPKCGTLIDPEDETETVYTILDTAFGDDDSLENMTIRCKKCNSTMVLEGFAPLFEEEKSRVEVSEALPEPEPGVKTLHTVSLDGRSVGQLTVEYAQKEDVETFKRLRNLHIGDAFKGTITISDTEKANPKDKDFQEIVKAAKRKFKGLRDNDIYVVTVKDGQTNFIGRASNLQG